MGFRPALMILMMSVVLPAYVKDKKLRGDVPSQDDLAKVQSYCVDTSGLSGPDRYVVEGFLKSEDKPKHLLTNLPWKLVEGCRNGEPDAVAKVDFVQLNATRLGTSRPTQPVGMTDARDPEAPVKVVLTVGDASSEKLLYPIEATPLTSTLDNSAMPADRIIPDERRDAVCHAFWNLIDDLQQVRSANAK